MRTFILVECPEEVIDTWAENKDKVDINSEKLLPVFIIPSWINWDNPILMSVYIHKTLSQGNHLSLGIILKGNNPRYDIDALINNLKLYDYDTEILTNPELISIDKLIDSKLYNIFDNYKDYEIEISEVTSAINQWNEICNVIYGGNK